MDNLSFLRKKMMRIRDATNSQLQEKVSLELISSITSKEIYKDSKIIYLYYPFQNELSPLPLFKQACLDQKIVAFPKVIKKGEMIFLQADLNTQFAEGIYKIKEPISKKVISSDGLMIVPLLGFKGSYRLGYGGNFYNNYLKKHRELYTIGIGYKCQVLTEDFQNENDIPLNEIISF